MNIDLPKFWLVLIRAVVLIVVACIVLAVPIYPWLHAHVVGSSAAWLGTLGVVLGFALALALVLWRPPIQWIVKIITRPQTRIFLWLVCAASFLLRLGVLRLVDWLPGQPAPDIFGSWVFYENSAIYPPGHSFVIAAVQFLLGYTYPPVAFFVCLMVVAVTLMVYQLARQAYGEQTARLAALAIAFMPSWLLYGDLEYDLMLGFFEVLLLFLFFHRPLQKHSFLWLALYGLLMGFTCLIKPIALLFPMVIFFIYLGLRINWFAALKRALVIALFMLVAISPWTIRNYLVMKKFVLISTNFGVILHTANNPEATGLEMMMKPTPEMTDEVIMNDMRIRMALDYISNNPRHFAQLTAYRIVWTWGSDCSFVSAALYDKVSDHAMDCVRAALQLPYITAVGLLGIGALLYRRQMFRTVLQAVLFAPVAYVWALHLVCQTHPQHHLPTLPFMLIFVAFVLARVAEPTPQPAAVAQMEQLEETA